MKTSLILKRRQSYTGVGAIPEQDKTTFEASEGMAVFDDETRSYWVSSRLKDKRGVVYDELSDQDKKEFDAARFKEIDNLLKFNALSVMTPEDSDRFAKTTAENIIPTSVLDKWKLQDDGHCVRQEQKRVGGLEGSHDLPFGARCTHTDAGRHHGDPPVVGISKGVGPHFRSD